MSKKISQIFIALCFASMLCFTSFTVMQATAQSNPELAIGSQMPMQNHGMENTDGTEWTLRQAKGENGTVIVFWCNTCPWVARYEDRFIKAVSALKTAGFGVIAVNPNDPESYPGETMTEMKKRAADKSYDFAYVADTGSQIAKAFGAARTPQIYLFDAENVLQYVGAIDDNPSNANGVNVHYLADAAKAISAGGTVAVKTSRAFGCTIKWQ